MPQDLERAQPQAVERQHETVYEALAALARDPAVPLERIVGLYDLQRRAEADEAKRQFDAAFSRLQPRMPRITKRGEIDMKEKGKLNFARYEDLDTAVRPLYTAEGFSLSFISEPTDKGIILVAVLAHAAGHEKTSRLQLPADAGPGRNGLQALGSALSYAKRYLTCDLFNIVTVGQDDDASSVGFIGEREVNLLQRVILTVGVDEAKLLTIYGAKALSDIPKGQIYEALQKQIEAKYRAKLQNEGNDTQEIGYKLGKLWSEQ